ncbi:MAG: glutathione S-transferase [Betaproteobacteria bacterium]|nr:MAG: glutathione S-transferase [Betaproteobacteria bacterium]
MLTLYGAKGSGAAAAEAALRIADVPFRWVEAASWEPGKGLEELKRVNSLAQIPTLLLEDGAVMTESAAILIWLGLHYPKSGLLPSDPAQAIRGLVYIAANCYSAIGIIDYPARYCAPCDDAMSERIRAGAKSRLPEYWRIFADEFGTHMNPAQPGALDLLAAVVSRWSGTRAHLKESRPAFHAMLEKVEADPRIAAIFQRHWPKK